jgi:uncharacterized protein (DUF58 family)
MTDDASASPFDDAFLAGLPRLEIAAARLVAREGEGAGRVDRRGGRVEFADHRPYAPGDELRHLDWSAYARSGKLFVKEFERRDEYSIVIVVDESASMAMNGKLVAAQRIAYALAYLGLAAGHRVRAALASDGLLRASGEVAGRSRMRDVAKFLLGARGRGGTRLTDSLARLREHGRGARLLVVLSDLWAKDDGRVALASRVRHGDEVDVFHLHAAADVAGPRDVFIAEDVETGERRALGPEAPAAAASAAARREEDWRAFAARHGVAYVPLDASRPTEELVLRTLRDAGILR